MSRRITAAVTAAALTLILATGGASGGPSSPGQLAPTNVTPPTVSGAAQVPNTLTASTGTWQGKGLKFGYQWLRCDSAGATCGAVSGATGTTMALSTSDVGYTLRVIVTATNRNGSAAATSAQTAVVASAASAPPPPPPPPPPPDSPPSSTSPPTASGTAVQGQTLTASTGSWSGSTPMSYAYQWQRCNSSGGACAAISGATLATYLVASADVGATMRVSVTASNSVGSATASSAATAVVAALSTPPYLQNAFEGDINADVSTSPFYAVPGVPNTFLTGAPGASGQAVNLQVNSQAWQPNILSNSTATAIQINASRAGATTSGTPAIGQSTWYRVKIMFPSGTHPFSPVPGDWNWTFEWHNDSHTASYGYVSPALGVWTDSNAQHWRFMWRPWGGLGSSPTVERWYTAADSVVRDHWYDLVVHFVWDTHASNAGGSGLIEFWVDGQPLNAGLGSPGSSTRWSNPHPFPTLTTNPDGTHSMQYNALYNYAGRTDGVPLWPRPDGAQESNIRYDGWVVGSTASSVGFTP